MHSVMHCVIRPVRITNVQNTVAVTTLAAEEANCIEKVKSLILSVFSLCLFLSARGIDFCDYHDFLYAMSTFKETDLPNLDRFASCVTDLKLKTF